MYFVSIVFLKLFVYLTIMFAREKLKELKPDEENPRLDYEEFLSLVRRLGIRT